VLFFFILFFWFFPPRFIVFLFSGQLAEFPRFSSLAHHSTLPPVVVPIKYIIGDIDNCIIIRIQLVVAEYNKTMNNMLNFDVVYINAIPMLFENTSLKTT
jgi:hypothetical protein